MKIDFGKIFGNLLAIGFLFVVAYIVLGGIYFRFSDPTYTETEIFLEVITLGGYERE